ncbi:DivIVA domain-containing protein [Pseudoglutamicibacter albus]|uniref:DivIVA domain-containing protein n=1 Tax=Pseudoglutamicibacter TaxID=1742991 RepID=UPI000C76B7E1|nr:MULTISPECIES: DivIVA domain-containing protein [Pseudoglutamicibacter]PKY79889.1 DivIVA domain-containing protein [Pseudoglutamicibacter albus]WIK84012.1 DivIVA domain-containing protein [Pseudoglutamicibacter albus]
MPLLVVFIAVIAAAAIAVAVYPRSSGRVTPLDDTPPMLGLPEPDPVLPPVVLPENPRGGDVDALRLPVAFRGYRCDVTDEVLDALALRIEALEAENAQLRSGAARTSSSK